METSAFISSKKCTKLANVSTSVNCALLISVEQHLGENAEHRIEYFYREAVKWINRR
jgi:hypothetical protein